MKTVEQRKSVVRGFTDGLSDCEGGDDHVELGAVKSYTDNPLHTQDHTVESNVVMERGDASATNETTGHPNSITKVSQQEHKRVVEEKETLKAEICGLKTEMHAVKAEKSKIEAEKNAAEAKLAEMIAKLERTETG